MSDTQAIREFSRLLAQTDDDTERVALVKRARLLAATMASPEAFEAPILSLGDYLDIPIPVPPTLVEPRVVIRGGLGVVIGRAGKGKTVCNLNRILRWSAGRPWFEAVVGPKGEPVFAPTDNKPLRTLIIENEGAGGLFHQQLGVMTTASEYVTADERELMRKNILVWGDGGYSGVRLDEPAKVDLIRAGIEKWEPDILFIEPFRGLWQGEENSSTDMAHVVDVLFQVMAEYNVGVLLSHHERKSGAGEDGEKMSAGRGSTVLEAAAVTMENFEGVSGGDYRELSISKHRYRDEFTPAPIRMEWAGTKKWYTHVSDKLVDGAILQALTDAHGEPLTQTELASILEEQREKLGKPLSRLTEEGRLKRRAGSSDGRGSSGYRYRLASNEDTEGGLSF